MTRKDEAVIVAARRTPIGKFLGEFADLSAATLGVTPTQAVLADAKLEPEAVDELFFGNARQAGGGPNVARQISMRAGLPQTVVASTINQACGSGLKTIILAAQEIWLGRAQVVIAGGTESMTGVPFLLPHGRLGYRLGHDKMVDGMYQDGFCCPICEMVMGETAEKLADQYHIDRPAQDQLALTSQLRAEAATRAGKFDSEIAAVTVPGRRADTVVETDGHPRAGMTLEKMAKLPPVFRTDGTVHAGNASGITDGAAAVLVMAAEEAKRRDLPILARIEDHASAGVDPSIMGIGPVPATAKLALSTGRQAADYDLVELNEAFAAQVLACQAEMHIPPDRMNVNGGAIALGHPIGATGTRIVVTLLHEMQRREARTGLATLCVSGGLGVSLSLVRD